MGLGGAVHFNARICSQTKEGGLSAPAPPLCKAGAPRNSPSKWSRSEAGGSSTFIFAGSLARPRPRSQQQSSRRARRAAKRVLEFLSASFSRAHLVEPAARAASWGNVSVGGRM